MIPQQLNRLALLALHIALLTVLPVAAIAGGKDAHLGDFPYTVSLRGRRNTHTCGGIIIDHNAILTAAHCVDGLTAGDRTVVAGSVALSSGGTTYHVSSIHMHPGFDSATLVNNIAVLKLAEHISYDFSVQPIALAMNDPPDASEALASGWGITGSSGHLPNILQWISLRVLDREECARELDRYFPVTVSQVCSSSKDGGGMCRADSGGPLTDDRKRLVGVFSRGVGCGNGYPDVYTNVAYHRYWILSHLD